MNLADTLISIFILTLITFLVIGIFFTYYSFFLTEVAYKNLNSDNVITLSQISSEIKNALNVIDSKLIQGTNYTTDQNTLILELPSIDSNQNIIPNTYDYEVFYQDTVNPKLLKSTIALGAGSVRQSTSTTLTSFLENINFNFNNQVMSGVSGVEIILSSATTVRSKIVTLGAQTTAKLRNK